MVLYLTDLVYYSRIKTEEFEEVAVIFITRECDYAVRVIRALADGSRKSVKEICDEENIPQPFAYKILKRLEQGGVIKIYRGQKGGYELNESLDRLTLYDIVFTMDVELFINECVRGDFECSQNTPGAPCKVHGEFNRLQTLLVDALQEKTLAQIFVEA